MPPNLYANDEDTESDDSQMPYTNTSTKRAIRGLLLELLHPPPLGLPPPIGRAATP